MSRRYSASSSRYSNDSYDNEYNNRPPKWKKDRDFKTGGRPTHLKGKEIGLWYAKKQKEKNERIEQGPVISSQIFLRQLFLGYVF